MEDPELFEVEVEDYSHSPLVSLAYLELWAILQWLRSQWVESAFVAIQEES